jgi:hypothetical protein
MTINWTRSIGMIVLCILLILWGLIALLPAFGPAGVVLPWLAILAGILLLIGL